MPLAVGHVVRDVQPVLVYLQFQLRPVVCPRAELKTIPSPSPLFKSDLHKTFLDIKGEPDDFDLTGETEQPGRDPVGRPVGVDEHIRGEGRVELPVRAVVHQDVRRPQLALPRNGHCPGKGLYLKRRSVTPPCSADFHTRE